MTLETITNEVHRDLGMKAKSRRFISQRKASKTDFNKAKVCFADNLVSVHEFPYNFDLSDNLKLPEIEAPKYTPLVFRDPYAKPSKRKKAGKFEDMFISDSVKLPFIKRKSSVKGLDAKKVARKVASKTRKETTESLVLNERNETKANTGTSEKLQDGQDGNTLHFKYSDFIRRKMDRSTISKDTRFIKK